MEAIKELIRPELLVLVPVLYFIGMGLKKSASVADKRIPLILGAAGVALSLVYLAAASPVHDTREMLMLLFVGITQGILCAGCSVYVNQVIKQSRKDEGP